MAFDQDIREKTIVQHEDVAKLNFIRPSVQVVFRKHFRQGLRSHIIEVLEKAAVRREIEGVKTNQIVTYPTAKPLKMLRLFKIKLTSLKTALREIEKFRILARYLAPKHIAQSDEFIVDYNVNGKYELILCGLQKYVEGEIIDPWQKLDEVHLESLFTHFRDTDSKTAQNPVGNGCHMISYNSWYRQMVQNISVFIAKIKIMIRQDQFVPDLSGVGNLIVTALGEVKLVDINNISPVIFDAAIRVDDKGYPACDKSIEVLAQLESKLLKQAPDLNDPIYQWFLDADRMSDVRRIESNFFHKLAQAK